MDEKTGKILFAKNATQARAVASTQKLLTALVAIDNGFHRKRLHVAKYDTRVEPSKLGIRSGESYNGDYLIQAMLVKKWK